MIDEAIDNRTLLWEVAGNEIVEPSYIIGTMHLMCAEDARLSNNLKDIISRVIQVFTEVDLTQS